VKDEVVILNERFDVVIKNGTIISGHSLASQKGDIGLKDGRISKVQSRIDDSAVREIDASSFIVSPGFIDMHSHSDYIMPLVGSADSFVRQGITTTVVGMCGSSIAPIHPEKKNEFKEELGLFVPPLKDIEIPWNTFGEYLDEMNRTPFAINTVHCVGYEAIRMAGGAGYENRPPTENEMRNMRNLVKEAMEAGAFGLSTGLIYAPQVFADTNELRELAKIVGQYKGLYFSHIRGEAKTVFAAIKEVEEIVRGTECVGAHVAHHKIADKEIWGQSTESLALVDRINEAGTSLTFDSYPYDRGCSGLVTALPPWVREGSTSAIIECLKDKSNRDRIVREVEKDINTDPNAIWENWIKTDGFENIFISHVENKRWKFAERMSITQIAMHEKDMDEWEVFFNILIDDEGSTSVTMKSMGDEDVRNIMLHPRQTFGTDGMACPVDYAYGISHPRSFGTYPRVLGKYVREERVMSLVDAIRKMTYLPAERLGLHDRGRIQEETIGDIVIFNPVTVNDNATYAEPNLFPDGIEYVIINGEIVVETGHQNSIFPGKVLRHKLV